MRENILIIDDEKDFIESVFIPNIKLWALDYNIITNSTFGDIDEEKLPIFIDEVIEIICANKNSIEVIFIDLGLNRSIDSPSMGFRVVKRIREKFIDIPIIALTRFSESEILEEV